MTTNPFDHGRDERLGALLRRHLDAGDPEPLVARALALIGAGDSSWDVLSRWWRPRIAAAAMMVLGLGLWFLLQRQPLVQAVIEDAIRPGDAPAELFDTVRPDAEVILTAVLEGR